MSTLVASRETHIKTWKENDAKGDRPLIKPDPNAKKLYFKAPNQTEGGNVGGGTAREGTLASQEE